MRFVLSYCENALTSLLSYDLNTIRALYIPTEKMIGEDREGTVDAIHFTDLGMMRYADVLYPILKRVIK